MIGFMIDAACTIPVVFGMAYSALSITFIRRREFQKLRPLAGALLITSVIFSLLIVYTFAGGFGAGLFMAVGSVISALLALMIAVIFGSISLFRTREEPGFRRSLLALCLFGGSVIPVAQLASVGGAIGFASACDTWHRSRAGVLISASEDYRGDHGRYPTELSELVPEYADRIPRATCLVPSRVLDDPDDTGYDIVRCEGTTVLHVMKTGGGGGQSYNFATGEWSHYDFLYPDPCYLFK